jgi:hypothetical protein
MSKFAQILTVILIFGVFLAFPASAQEVVLASATASTVSAPSETEWTRDVLQNMYIQYLREEGYLPSLDGDGDILFKVSGNNYFIILDENDFQNNLLFFRIYTGVSLGDFLPEDALAAANYINMHSKVAKVYISTDGRSIAINTELLLTNPQDFKAVLSRALSLMRFAESNFFSRLGADLEG